MNDHTAIPAPATAPAASELAGQPPAHGGAPTSEPGQTPDPQAAPPVEPEEKKINLRFSELTKQRNEAEIRAAEERGRRIALEEAIRNGLGQPQPQRAEPPQPTAEAPDPEPNPAHYPGKEWDTQYIKDWARWDNRQQVKAAQSDWAKTQEANQRAAQERMAFEAGKAAFEDAVQFCNENAQTSPNAASTLMNIARALPNELVDLVTQDDHVDRIAEYLHAYPQYLAEMQRDAAQGRVARAAARIGQIALHVRPRAAPAAGASPSSQPPRTAAPTPGQVAIPPPVNGGGAAGSPNPASMSMEEFVRWRSSQ